MFKYLKAEYLKMVHSKHLLWINVLLLLYTALILLLYYSDGLHAYDILPNYNDEYFVLFLMLSVFWGLSSVGDEMNYRTDLWYSKNKFILFKVFFLALYILFIYILSFIMFNLCTFVIHNAFYFSFSVIFSLLKCFPLYFFWGLFSMFISVVIRKSNISMLIIVSVFLWLEYIKGALYNLNGIFKYIFIFHLNMNKVIVEEISFESSAIINLIAIVFVIYLIFISYYKRS